MLPYMFFPRGDNHLLPKSRLDQSCAIQYSLITVFLLINQHCIPFICLRFRNVKWQSIHSATIDDSRNVLQKLTSLNEWVVLLRTFKYTWTNVVSSELLILFELSTWEHLNEKTLVCPWKRTVCGHHNRVDEWKLLWYEPCYEYYWWQIFFSKTSTDMQLSYKTHVHKTNFGNHVEYLLSN